MEIVLLVVIATLLAIGGLYVAQRPTASPKEQDEHVRGA